MSIIYELQATAFRVWDRYGQRTWTPFTLSPADRVGRAAGQAAFADDETGKAGLRNGDIVTTVNGRSVVGRAVLGEEINRTPPGGALRVTVSSRDSGDQPELTVVLHRPTETRLGLAYVVIVVILPWLTLLLGFWVVFSRPSDPKAWLVLALMWIYMCFYYPGTEFWRPWLRDFGVAFRASALSSLPIWFLLFGLHFPEDFARGSRWERMSKWKWILVFSLALIALSNVGVAVADLENWHSLHQLRSLLEKLRVSEVLLQYLATAVGFFALAAKYLSAVSLDSKRRLRLLFVGAVLSLSPYLVVRLAQALGSFNFEQRHQDLAWLIYVVFFLFPFVLAYLILVHKAMDVRVVLRQGLQYALATNGVRVIQFVFTVVIFFTAVVLVAGSGNRLREVAVIVAGLLLVQAIGRGSDKVRLWVDRRFFREAYNTERVLTELSDHIRTMVEPQSLLRSVVDCISSSLHVPQIAVLLENGERFCPAHLQDVGDATLSFSRHSHAVAELERTQEPLRVYLGDRDSWVYQNSSTNNGELADMARLQTELLLPLSGRKKLLGFISLGPKRSQEPFTHTDLRLLKSVATQAGLALENAQLLTTITQQVAQRERLNREIEIAREVQERLLPQAFPAIRGLDGCGACRPAGSVGGDYYDFLKLQTGELSLAIGDVSGKGIGAALLMASLVLTLRSEAVRAQEQLKALVRNVNLLVYQASTINRYATLFFGLFDPQTNRLTYINAGHDPPLLFRKSHDKVEVTRLSAGGTVIGLFEEFPYEEGTVTLQSGDVLMAFTDGVIDAMNPSEQHFGEERLVDAATSCMDLTAAEILSRIMQTADSFAAGAPQHDDMTLVVLRIL